VTLSVHRGVVPLGRKLFDYLFSFSFRSVVSYMKEEAEVDCAAVDAAGAVGAFRELASASVSIDCGATCTAAGDCFEPVAVDTGACAAEACGEPAPVLVGACAAGVFCFEPVLTNMSTVEPSSTIVPAAGSCSITTPAGTLSLEVSFRFPSLSPVSLTNYLKRDRRC
jgi:hypothetical protein